MSDGPRRNDEKTIQVPVFRASQVSVASGDTKKDRCTLLMLAGPVPGTVVSLDDHLLVIGRGAEASCRIEDEGLSRLHARLYDKNGKFYIEDLGSTNGTYVSGVRIASPVELTDGDRILVGKTTLFRVHLQDAFEQEATRRLYDSAVRDALTQVYNRRHLDERIKAEVAYSVRHGTSIGILLLDVDHFKRVNDTYGHAAGDSVLRAVAAMLEAAVRAEDMVARYGGEEFCILARGIDHRGALALGERIRRKVEETSIAWEGQNISLTLSVGLAMVGLDAKTPEDLLARADAHLYMAKEQGRNRVVG